jgi:hypothetical protein
LNNLTDLDRKPKISRTNDNAMAWVAGVVGVFIPLHKSWFKLASSVLPFVMSKKQIAGEDGTDARQFHPPVLQSKNAVGMKAVISMLRRQTIKPNLTLISMQRSRRNDLKTVMADM